jgi:hypothetical protein
MEVENFDSSPGSRTKDEQCNEKTAGERLKHFHQWASTADRRTKKPQKFSEQKSADTRNLFFN